MGMERFQFTFVAYFLLVVSFCAAPVAAVQKCRALICNGDNDKERREQMINNNWCAFYDSIDNVFYLEACNNTGEYCPLYKAKLDVNYIACTRSFNSPTSKLPGEDCTRNEECHSNDCGERGQCQGRKKDS